MVSNFRRAGDPGGAADIAAGGVGEIHAEEEAGPRLERSVQLAGSICEDVAVADDLHVVQLNVGDGPVLAVDKVHIDA